jgi:dCTP deaminase
MARSSYARLGMPINVMVQPGYRGSIGVQLFNHGNNPLELVVGSRVFQARFFELDSARTHVGAGDRKYLGNVRPAVSRASEDHDLARLTDIRSNRR